MSLYNEEISRRKTVSYLEDSMIYMHKIHPLRDESRKSHMIRDGQHLRNSLVTCPLRAIFELYDKLLLENARYTSQTAAARE